MREGLGTVVGKVLVHMPGLSKVIGSVDVHGSWPESGELNDHVREMELRLQIQLDRHVFLAVLRLPPGLLATSWRSLVDDGANSMVPLRIILRGIVRLAQEALGLLQMGHDAVTLRMVNTTGRGGLQTVLTTDQQVASGGVTGALFTGMLSASSLLSCELEIGDKLGTMGFTSGD